MMPSQSGLASAFFGIRSTAGGLASPEDQHVIVDVSRSRAKETEVPARVGPRWKIAA
ncbi:hypothetical protein [Sorangium sp. So ce394]|uniref:hypothetical protein n=1 Tax=Sorangium sp. So ce394 TaxID=3133310 RepID=UPI003F5C2F87